MQKLEDLGMTPCFRYLISGGDYALLLSKELPGALFEPLVLSRDTRSGFRALQLDRSSH